MAVEKEPQPAVQRGDKEENKKRARDMFSRRQSTTESTGGSDEDRRRAEQRVKENEEEFGAKVGTEEYGRALVDKSLPEHAALENNRQDSAHGLQTN